MNITASTTITHTLDLDDLPEPVIALRTARWLREEDSAFQVTHARERLIESVSEAGDSTRYAVELRGPKMTKASRPHGSHRVEVNFTLTGAGWNEQNIADLPVEIRALLVGIEGLRYAFYRQRIAAGVRPNPEFVLLDDRANVVGVQVHDAPFDVARTIPSTSEES